MARLPAPMWDHDGNEPTTGVMAASFIKKYESFMTQERRYLVKPDIAGRIIHLCN